MTFGPDLFALLAASLGALCKLLTKVQEFNDLETSSEDIEKFINRQKLQLTQLEERYHDVRIYHLTLPDSPPREEKLQAIWEFVQNYRKVLLQGEAMLSPLHAKEKTDNETAASSAKYSALRNLKKMGMVAGGVGSAGLGSLSYFNQTVMRYLAEAQVHENEIEKIFELNQRRGSFHSTIEKESQFGRIGNAAATAYEIHRPRVIVDGRVGVSGENVNLKGNAGLQRAVSDATTLVSSENTPVILPLKTGPKSRFSTISSTSSKSSSASSSNSSGTFDTYFSCPEDGAESLRRTHTSSIIRQTRFGPAAASYFRVHSSESLLCEVVDPDVKLAQITGNTINTVSAPYMKEIGSISEFVTAPSSSSNTTNTTNTTTASVGIAYAYMNETRAPELRPKRSILELETEMDLDMEMGYDMDTDTVDIELDDPVNDQERELLLSLHQIATYSSACLPESLKESLRWWDYHQ